MSDKRLDQLNVSDRDSTVNTGYTRFVKYMRFILPFAALTLTVIVLTWPEMDNKVTVIPKEDIAPQTEIGENELVNPHFKTTDAQQQPIDITAIRAIQNQENPNLIKLDKPNADLKMKDGSTIQIKADRGIYEQEVEKLFLEQNVQIHHGSGYTLFAEELRINMKTQEAFSDKTVRIKGSKAEINAKGLEGNMKEGILIFKGPATLTLNPNEKNAIKTKGKDENANESNQ